ncbi:hypothetical protein XENTR_v10010012 [Xenopus tropicalis]|nr:hypothetical protein XENTR_v10010012 [Xenopus tropicalis]
MRYFPFSFICRTVLSKVTFLDLQLTLIPYQSLVLAPRPLSPEVLPYIPQFIPPIMVHCDQLVKQAEVVIYPVPIKYIRRWVSGWDLHFVQADSHKGILHWHHPNRLGYIVNLFGHISREGIARTRAVWGISVIRIHFLGDIPFVFLAS